jgi:hypothetical protein
MYVSVDNSTIDNINKCNIIYDNLIMIELVRVCMKEYCNEAVNAINLNRLVAGTYKSSVLRP